MSKTHTLSAAAPLPRIRRASARPTAVRELHLLPGQPAMLALRRGWVLHAQAGTLALREAPETFADSTWQPRHVLPAGAVWVAPRDGWVSLGAGAAPARLLLRECSEPGWWRRLLAAFRGQ